MKRKRNQKIRKKPGVQKGCLVFSENVEVKKTDDVGGKSTTSKNEEKKKRFARASY